MNMDETPSKKVIWTWGAAAGVLSFILFYFNIIGHLKFWPALFLAILVAILVAILIWLLFYRGTGSNAASAPMPAAAEPASASGSSKVAADMMGDAGRSLKSDTSGSEPSAAAEAPKPAAKTKPAAKPKPKTAAKKAAPKKEAEVDYDGDGKMEGENEGTKPAGLKAARKGGADDLKKIKGVGPKLEKMLNEMGFYHFDQIAGWSADEVAWVNANLAGFKGRVSRDNWIEQATTLAAGGDTAFSKKVDKGGVY